MQRLHCCSRNFRKRADRNFELFDIIQYLLIKKSYQRNRKYSRRSGSSVGGHQWERSKLINILNCLLHLKVRYLYFQIYLIKIRMINNAPNISHSHLDKKIKEFNRGNFTLRRRYFAILSKVVGAFKNIHVTIITSQISFTGQVRLLFLFREHS